MDFWILLIIDRISIIQLKIERINDPIFQAEFNELKRDLEEFKKRGIEIKKEWIDELYEINKEAWDLLEEMNEEKEKKENYDKIGRLYLKAEEVNKRRAYVKNKIVEKTGIGFKEIKKNHPSE